MCQRNELMGINGKCICGPSINDRLLTKKELLARLKEHKQNLESALDNVNKNLESTAIAAKGGD